MTHVLPSTLIFHHVVLSLLEFEQQMQLTMFADYPVLLRSFEDEVVILLGRLVVYIYKLELTMGRICIQIEI